MAILHVDPSLLLRLEPNNLIGKMPNAFVIWGTFPSIVSTSKLVLGPRVSWKEFPSSASLLLCLEPWWLFDWSTSSPLKLMKLLGCYAMEGLVIWAITCWTSGVLFFCRDGGGFIGKFLTFSRPSFRFELAINFFWPFEPRIPNPSLHLSCKLPPVPPPLGLH